MPPKVEKFKATRATMQSYPGEASFSVWHENGIGKYQIGTREHYFPAEPISSSQLRVFAAQLLDIADAIAEREDFGVYDEA